MSYDDHTDCGFCRRHSVDCWCYSTSLWTNEAKDDRSAWCRHPDDPSAHVPAAPWGQHLDAAYKALDQAFLDAKPVEPKARVLPGDDEVFQQASDALQRQVLAGMGIPPAQEASTPSGENTIWNDILNAYRLIELAPRRRTEPIKLTEQQLEAIRAEQPERQAWESGVVADLFGVPIEKVDTVEESTPYLEASKHATGGIIRPGDLGSLTDEGGCSYVIPNRYDPNAVPSIIDFSGELTDEEFERIERRWRWALQKQGTAMRVLNDDGSHEGWFGHRPPWWKRAYFQVRRWLA